MLKQTEIRPDRLAGDNGRRTPIGKAVRLEDATRPLPAKSKALTTRPVNSLDLRPGSARNDQRPWQRESRVMLNESMARLDHHIARLQRELHSRGTKRPDVVRKLVTLVSDAVAKRELVFDEILRREAMAKKNAPVASAPVSVLIPKERKRDRKRKA